MNSTEKDGPGKRLVKALGSGAERIPVVALVAWAAIGIVLSGGLDDSLKAMHPPEGVAASATDITTPLILADLDGAREAVSGWKGWDPSSGAVEYLGPGVTLLGYVVVDALLLALPITLLLLALIRSLSRNWPASERTASDPLIVLAAAQAGVLVYLAADMAEDFALGFFYRSATTVWASVIGFASGVKWIALGLAVASLAYAAVVLRKARRKRPGESPRFLQQVETRLWRPILVLRALFAVVAILIVLMILLPGEVGRQVSDLIVGLPRRPLEMVFTVVGALGLALLLLAGRTTISAYAHPPEWRHAPRLRWYVLTAVVLLLLGGIGQSFGLYLWPAIIPPAALLLLFAGLSLPKGVKGAKPPEDSTPDFSGLDASLRALVILPPALLALASLRASVTLLVAQDFVLLLWLLSIAAGLGLVSVLLWVYQGHHPPRAISSQDSQESSGSRHQREWPKWVILLHQREWPKWVILLLVIAIGPALWPLQVGELLGPLAIVFLFFGALLALTTTLVLLGDRHFPRGILAFLQLRRVPYLSLVVVSAIVASYINVSGHYHDVRLADERPEEVQISLRRAFRLWVDEQVEAQGETEDGRRGRRPMVMIASAGGGIRAAYWTTLVMDCLFLGGLGPRTREDPGGVSEACRNLRLPDGAVSSVFVASGISGGSVGLAATHATEHGLSSSYIFEDSRFLGPVVAAMGFRDLPNGLLYLEMWADRARILELAWERAAPQLGNGFAESSFSRERGLQFPLMLLNGATVDGGCRLAASVLNLSGEEREENAPGEGVIGSTTQGSCLTVESVARPSSDGRPQAVLARTRDLFDYACSAQDWSASPREVSISSAALLSARFPYVSPSGGLTSCTDQRWRTFVVDGGVIEVSGAGPLVELFTVMSPWIRDYNADHSNPICIEPRLILMDNGYVDPVGWESSRRPQELLAPAGAVLSARGATTPAARQAAAIAFQWALDSVAPCAGEVEGSRGHLAEPSSVAHLYPRLHPGPIAPLGWSLSDWAEKDLRDQLVARGTGGGREDNLLQLEKIGRWFHEEL